MFLKFILKYRFITIIIIINKKTMGLKFILKNRS